MMKLRRPKWWAVLLTLVGVALFVGLGVWQLRRAEFKEQLLARFAHATQRPLQPLADVVNKKNDDVYPHVLARGRLEGDKLYVLDDQTRHDRRGVLVFAPMQVCIGSQGCDTYMDKTLMVALGFLPYPPGRRDVPKLPPVRAKPRTLTGLYAPPPASGLKLGGNALQRQATWPKLTSYLDLAQVSNDLGQPLDTRVLLLDQNPATPYIRSWTPATMPPARHRAYALQWFTFALAAIAIFLVVNRKRRTPEDDDEPDRENP